MSDEQWTDDTYDKWVSRFRGTAKINGSLVDYFEADEAERLFDAVRDSYEARLRAVEEEREAANKRVTELEACIVELITGIEEARDVLRKSLYEAEESEGDDGDE